MINSQQVVVIYCVTLFSVVRRRLCKSMYEAIRINVHMCMGKNNNDLVYYRLISATVLYSLTTVLYFLYSTLDILW